MPLLRADKIGSWGRGNGEGKSRSWSVRKCIVGSPSPLLKFMLFLVSPKLLNLFLNYFDWVRSHPKRQAESDAIEIWVPVPWILRPAHDAARDHVYKRSSNSAFQSLRNWAFGTFHLISYPAHRSRGLGKKRCCIPPGQYLVIWSVALGMSSTRHNTVHFAKSSRLGKEHTMTGVLKFQ